MAPRFASFSTAIRRRESPRSNRADAGSMPLEKLHGALVLLGARPARKRAEVSAPAGLRIDLARVEPVLAAPEAANHRELAFARFAFRPVRAAGRARRFAALFA